MELRPLLRIIPLMCGADDRVAFSRNATRKSGGGRQVLQRGQGRWASTVDWVVIVACRSTQEGWQRRETQHNTDSEPA